MAAAAIDFANGNVFVASERDEKTRLLAAVLFPLLLDECDVNSSLNNSLPEVSSEDSSTDGLNDSHEDIYDSAQTISESVIFCYVFMRKPHLKVSKFYFSKHPMCRKSVFRFLKNYCCVISKQSSNIHFAVLHSLAFVYHAIEFCTDRGNLEFQSFIPLWWEYIFNKIFKDEFYNEGNWIGFKKYVKGDFYIDMTRPEFRLRFNLTSATLGCDFSLLEQSDVDDFQSSDESSTSSKKKTLCNPNEVSNAQELCNSHAVSETQNTGNANLIIGTPESLCNPDIANKEQNEICTFSVECNRGSMNENKQAFHNPQNTGNANLINETPESLCNPDMANKEQNEICTFSLEYNRGPMNENKQAFHNPFVSETWQEFYNQHAMNETREEICNPHVMNETRESLGNHATNESQQTIGVSTSVIKTGHMLHYKTTMMEHQKILHSQSARNETQQTFCNPTIMNEMQQTCCYPPSEIKIQEVFGYQNGNDKPQQELHSPIEVNVVQQTLENQTKLNETQESFYIPISSP